WETSLAEEEFAQWFQETYLLPPWDVWFFVASLTPGIPAHQQHIESHHKRIKQVCAHELRATTSVVLEHTIPRIVVADAIQPDHTPATWIDAPISGEVLAKALVLLKPRNHRLVEEQSCICFNSSSHFGISITLSRMKKYHTLYLDSLNGEGTVHLLAEKIKDAFLSLHIVHVDEDIEIRENVSSLEPFTFNEV
ncbi:hypothetical protein AaE_002829, partial [Aphanomyces astaci]